MKKKTLTLTSTLTLTLVLALTLSFPLYTEAQTLNVKLGNVTYQFPSAQAGDMTYSDGSMLSIMGRSFNLSDITSMTVTDATVTDDQVNVAYSEGSATVTIAGNVAQYVDATVSGAHVTITQSDAVTNDLIKAGTMNEIIYSLSGEASDGSLTLAGSAKCEVDLNGLTLTNPNGAPINITNGKRIAMSIKKGTTNTLTDGAASTDKACLYCKGHLELKGKGTLTVYAYGSAAHGIKSGDYTEMKNCTVNVLAATKDGLSCNEYFLMTSGTLNISGTGDDGIQCDIDNDEGTPIAATDAAEGGHEDEDTGNIYLEGGTINISVTADAAKGIKAEGDMIISEADSATPLTVTVTTSGGGVWDSTKVKTKAASCLGADGNMTISGGTLSLTSTGAGGKGINVDGTFTATGGTTTINTSGNAVVASSSGVLSTVTQSNQLDSYESDYKSSPKGIKVDGAIAISDDAVINVTTTGAGGEGIESKTYINITGGETTIIAADDAINASYNDDTKSLTGAGDFTITGGYLYAYSTGNDGIDANGNCYINGGLVYAIGSGGAEKSIDANTEEKKQLYVQGGTIIAVGDLEGGASISGGTCKYTTSWTGNSTYALYNGGTLVAAFTTPTKSSSSQGGGFGGGGFGGGQSSNSQKLILYTSSTPTLQSGVTVTGGTEYFGGKANIGCTVTGGTSVSLSQYTSSSQGGGPK